MPPDSSALGSAEAAAEASSGGRDRCWRRLCCGRRLVLCTAALAGLQLLAAGLSGVGGSLQLGRGAAWIEDALVATGPGRPQQAKPNVRIVVVADGNFKQRYEVQLESQRCFARRNGYPHAVLTGWEYKVCLQYRDFFFRKHCTIAEWMESLPPDSMVAVLDADVVAFVLDRGLGKWARHGADVQLYERITLPEIMAGNYMVRNTPFARAFLRRWASYARHKPLGFSSSDNGAIHLVVMEAVGVDGFKRCFSLYRSLTKPVTDLDDYWEFVKCTKDALGPPRNWKAGNGSRLTVWPRAQFFAVDGVYLQKLGSPSIGPLMHHGMKEREHVTDYYYQNLSQCAVNPKVLCPAQHLGAVALQLARMYPKFFWQGAGCRQCAERCVRNFSCPPLEDSEEPVPQRSHTDNATWPESLA